jgi:flagellar M-ring protein FliF
VANAPFTAIDKSESELPIWKDPENVSFLKDILKYLLIAGIVAFLYLKVIQPTLKTMFPPPESDKTKAGEAEGGLFGAGRSAARKKARKGRRSISTTLRSRSRRHAIWRPRTPRPSPT